MLGNVAFALRSIMRKGLSAEWKDQTNMNADNEFAVSTLLSLLFLAPFTYLYSKPEDFTNLAKVMSQGIGSLSATNVIFYVFACGISFYLYNEMQSKVLEKTDAVTAAVGNTLKRVAIFVGLFYCVAGETFPPGKILGSVIAVVGCLAYAICDSMKL